MARKRKNASPNQQGGRSPKQARGEEDDEEDYHAGDGDYQDGDEKGGGADASPDQGEDEDGGRAAGDSGSEGEEEDEEDDEGDALDEDEEEEEEEEYGGRANKTGGPAAERQLTKAMRDKGWYTDSIDDTLIGTKVREYYGTYVTKATAPAEKLQQVAEQLGYTKAEQQAEFFALNRRRQAGGHADLTPGSKLKPGTALWTLPDRTKPMSGQDFSEGKVVATDLRRYAVLYDRGR
eukprot:SAG22_NODE_741_length_7507_cov_2.893224_1_plen_235_part_00